MNKYARILEEVVHRIDSGQYARGERLPSVRSAAKSYGVSVSTVIRAYAELEKQHRLYSIAQSGYYVVDKPASFVEASGSDTIDFTASSPDPAVFPVEDFQHCLNRALEIYKQDLFTCGDPHGMETLRRTLASQLAGDQVFTKADNVIVTSGANQALEILAKMPFPGGKSVILVEQPSYDLYLRFLEAERIPVRGIARTADGIDLDELEVQFKAGDIKFFYTIPRYHCPIGSSYSIAQRRAIVRLAGKYGVYVVEDDYMGDLGEEPGLDPIYAYDDSSHVVYVKSFSKMIFPGLRIGTVVVPDRLREAFCTSKRYADTSQLSQAALELYIRNGMFERHRRIIRNQYAARMTALMEALRRYDESQVLAWPDIRYGMYAQVKLPHTVNLDRLIAKLDANRIKVVSGKTFYLSDWRDRAKFVRMSVARVNEEQIEQGVQAFCGLLDF